MEKDPTKSFLNGQVPALQRRSRRRVLAPGRVLRLPRLRVLRAGRRACAPGGVGAFRRALWFPGAAMHVRGRGHG